MGYPSWLRVSATSLGTLHGPRQSPDRWSQFGENHVLDLVPGADEVRLRKHESVGLLVVDEAMEGMIETEPFVTVERDVELLHDRVRVSVTEADSVRPLRDVGLG